MNVRYDPEADILYILIKEGEVSDSDEVDEDIWVEYDKEGKIAGIEIWSASRRVSTNLKRTNGLLDYTAEDAEKDLKNLKEFLGRDR